MENFEGTGFAVQNDLGDFVGGDEMNDIDNF